MSNESTTNESKVKRAVRTSRPKPQLKLSGDFIDDVFKVTDVSMSLLVSPGEESENEQMVLVPFVALTMSGDTEVNGEGAQKVFSDVLSIENAASVIADLSIELARVTSELEVMATGKLKPELLQLKLTAKSLTQAQKAIAQCQIGLRALGV